MYDYTVMVVYNLLMFSVFKLIHVCNYIHFDSGGLFINQMWEAILLALFYVCSFISTSLSSILKCFLIQTSYLNHCLTHFRMSWCYTPQALYNKSPPYDAFCFAVYVRHHHPMICVVCSRLYVTSHPRMSWFLTWSRSTRKLVGVVLDNSYVRETSIKWN